MNCEKCQTPLVGIACPDKQPACEVFHTGCPVCDKAPVPTLPVSRPNGISGDIVKAIAVSCFGEHGIKSFKEEVDSYGITLSDYAVDLEKIIAFRNLTDRPVKVMATSYVIGCACDGQTDADVHLAVEKADADF